MIPLNHKRFESVPKLSSGIIGSDSFLGPLVVHPPNWETPLGHVFTEHGTESVTNMSQVAFYREIGTGLETVPTSAGKDGGRNTCVMSQEINLGRT